MGYGFWDMSSRVSCGGWGEEEEEGGGFPQWATSTVLWLFRPLD